MACRAPMSRCIGAEAVRVWGAVRPEVCWWAGEMWRCCLPRCMMGGGDGMGPGDGLRPDGLTAFRKVSVRSVAMRAAVASAGSGSRSRLLID